MHLNNVGENAIAVQYEQMDLIPIHLLPPPSPHHQWLRPLKVNIHLQVLRLGRRRRLRLLNHTIHLGFGLLHVPLQPTDRVLGRPRALHL
jgi:hypothetical protein